MKNKKYNIVFLCVLLSGLTACTSQGPQIPIDTTTAALSDTSLKTEQTDTKERKEAYQKVLEEIYTNQTFPDNVDRGYDGYDITENKFAIYDIDSDGKEELLIIYTTTFTAGKTEIIYDYDSETNTVREQFSEFPAMRYYQNGVIEVDWSHNQGLAGEFWPYTMYQYSQDTDSYQEIASVDAWDKNLRETNYEGNPFPDQIDVNGDGLIYYIKPKGVTSVDPVDLEQYNQWRESKLEGAEEINVAFMDLTEKNIQNIVE